MFISVFSFSSRVSRAFKRIGIKRAKPLSATGFPSTDRAAPEAAFPSEERKYRDEQEETEER